MDKETLRSVIVPKFSQIPRTAGAVRLQSEMVKDVMESELLPMFSPRTNAEGPSKTGSQWNPLDLANSVKPDRMFTTR